MNDDVKNIGAAITGFISAIIGLAILAVILSNSSNTVNVLTTFFSGFAGLIQTAVSPVTGGTNATLGTISNLLGGTTTAQSVVGNIGSLLGNGVNTVSSTNTGLLGGQPGTVVDNTPWEDALPDTTTQLDGGWVDVPG